MTLSRSVLLIWVVIALGWCSCLGASGVQGATVVDGRAIVGERGGANWLSYGRTYSENFYSPLAGINEHNVSRLGLAWFVDLPGERTLEGTPLAIGGVLYFSGTYGRTYAVDARTHRTLWKFDPESGRYRADIFRFSGSLGGNRGVAYWQGRVYVGVVDGRLFALDAKTGQVVWEVQTFDDPKAHKAISGAPRVFNGKVIIGHDGELGGRAYVTAYDAVTGEQRWRFYTVPGDPSKGFESSAMAMAAKTWTGQWWQSGGNGSVWDSIVYDPELNRVYLGTANWNQGAVGKPRTDNLFVSSVVALDADSGAYLWHYQETPRGDWDYDSTAPMVLATLNVGGTQRRVLLHAPKNGFFYVIDRSDGKVLSAEKFTKVTWAERIDLKSGRPVETTNVREIWPEGLGAHSWQPMSFNPRTGLVYIPTMKLGMRWDTYDTLLTEMDDGTGSLLAWDPVAQMKGWEVKQDSFFNGGVMSTAGNLVFQGTGRGEFVAYSARSGNPLWRFNAGLGIFATPISYAVDGVQYISVLVGYGGSSGLLGKQFDYGWRFDEQPRRLLTFALGRVSSLPPGKPPRFTVEPVDDPTVVIDAEQAARGAQVYGPRCTFCHGPDLEDTGSFAPDLRESALAMNWPAFKTVLHEGSLAPLGMPKFDDLSDDDMRAIYIYIRQRAREATHPAAP